MATFKENTIPGIFQNRVEKYGDRACVSYKKGGVYTDISWNGMNEMIRSLALYLLSLGVKKGDRVGLFSENRFEWWVADQAILAVGAINVPIYSTNSSEEAQFILNDSGSRLCFVSTEDHLERVLKAKKKLSSLKNIVIFNHTDREKKDILTFESALRAGRASKQKALFDKKLKAVTSEDLATIMYTSGTTGNPKGVMLTHSNFISQGENIYHELQGMMDENDVFLSFLPLSHVLERTCGYYAPVYIGATVAFAEDISKLVENFKEVRPTIIISVPRIYEKIHTGILSQVADAPALKKAIFGWAMKTAQKNLPYSCKSMPRTGLFAKRFEVADKMVFSKLKAALGLDNMRFAISGGGPLSVSDAEFFVGMGIQILEGFGLTETSPVTNFNRPGEITPGSVGRAIPKTKLKISDDGELLIKGPQVMKGYYKNPKVTKEAFTKDGYFRTGDMARIDEEGRLWITGRIKDIIVTSGGKNISPQNIENSLKTSRFIEQVAIIGDNRKYLAALIVPAFEELTKWAKKNALSATGREDLLRNDAIMQLFEEEIARYTKHYARVEQIRKFRLLDAEWTQESGELTPSQKVKRRVINEKYAAEIESMYPPEA
jgi:long-chain acyl-CoA synthetase